MTAGDAETITEDAQSRGNKTNAEERVKKKYMESAYKSLYNCASVGRIDWLKHLLKKGEVTLTDKITNNGNTALHVAMGTSKDPKFIAEMLTFIPDENISLTNLKNSNGSTLLHIAASVGNTAAVKILLKRYPNMLCQRDNEGQTPLAVALSNMHTETANYMLDISKTDTLFSGTSGDELLVHVISSKDFQLAWRLLKCYSKMDSDVVLMAIAQNYPCELSFWERIASDRKLRIVEFGCEGAGLSLQRVLTGSASWRRVIHAYLYLGYWKISYLFQSAIKKCVFPFVKRRLRIHEDAYYLLIYVYLFIIDSISSSHYKNFYNNPILEATRQNAMEVVILLESFFPDAFWSESEDGHNVIQYAVINRSEKIYNLLYHMSERKNVYKTIKDTYGNNLLHLAARLAPSEKLNLISGEALQIQYELQWYKEVERFVCPINITQKNSSQETPQMVFTRTHKELVTEGEKWMKSTAKSYTITAALITTIVFAAAITVPGGNTQDTGVPIFTNNPAFTIFAVSDAISLFTAVMSLLMFLSILTARFAEEDFLYMLPRKLIVGLVTLFISTTTMIIAFGAALFIVFGQKNALLLIPIGSLTGLTITFFVALQFPLVIDLVSATYCRRIFGRNAITIFGIPFNI